MEDQPSKGCFNPFFLGRPGDVADEYFGMQVDQAGFVGYTGFVKVVELETLSLDPFPDLGQVVTAHDHV